MFARQNRGVVTACAGIALLTMVLSAQIQADTPKDWVAANLPDLVRLYRELHASPELSFHEEKTAALIAQEFERVGAEVHTGIGGHGVVGLLRNGAGPTLMLRTDLDGLPVKEQTGLVYSSQVTTKDDAGNDVGVMHACGHDVHMTNVVGVARYLSQNKEVWQGTLMLLGQPAEERGAGAKAMLSDGLFDRFTRPDFAIALHCDSALAAGRVGVRGGYTLANVDSVDITMRGQGGHGAYPQSAIDPIVQASQLVMDLQTIVSREVAPTDPAVITVGSIHGGTKHNIIGDHCHLQITVRTYTDAVRREVLDAIQRKAKAVAQGAGAPEPEIAFSEGTPALWNDETLAVRAGDVFRRVLGDDQVRVAELSMGGEDFSQYGKAGVPILMFRLGTVEAQRLARFELLGQTPPALHSPLFYPDVEPTLTAGVVATSSVVLDLLKP